MLNQWIKEIELQLPREWKVEVGSQTHFVRACGRTGVKAIMRNRLGVPSLPRGTKISVVQG